MVRIRIKVVSERNYRVSKSVAKSISNIVVMI